MKYAPVKAYTVASVNMRKGPSTKYGSNGVLRKGASVKIYLLAKAKGESQYWYYLKADGISKGFFVRSDLIKAGAAPKASTPSSSISSGSTGSNVSNSTTQTTGAYIAAEGFPASYKTKLAALHKLHPTWRFTPVKTGLDWNRALSAMTANLGTNTIYSSYAPSYRSTAQGAYNYLANKYTPRDGANFFAASPQAAAYYMDPRNWLTESYIFQFESNTYHAYQTEDIVKSVVSGNKVLAKNAKYFVEAGKRYGISPIYLAAKSYSELGSATSMIDGTYKGYKGYYNAYCIGCSDTASGGAVNGMKYAKKQGWNTLRKAIVNGAAFLKTGYISNRQDSGYLEHFNVRNGLANVGTHVYMTAVYAPASNSTIVYNRYRSYGIMGKNLEFFIPVYNNMPASAAPKPSNSANIDNNNYLKTLKVAAGGKTKTLISSGACNYKSTFTYTVPDGSTSAKLSAVKASSRFVTIHGTGTKTLKKGTNTFQILVYASSGQTRVYTVKLIRNK